MMTPLCDGNCFDCKDMICKDPKETEFKRLIRENKELKEDNHALKESNIRLGGMIDGLKFALMGEPRRRAKE